MSRWLPWSRTPAPVALPGVGLLDGEPAIRADAGSFSRRFGAGEEPGFGAYWWSSGTRTWLWWAALVVAGGVIAADQFYDLRFGYLRGTVAINSVGDFAEIGVGLLFWMWRPGNIIGPLMLAYVELTNVGDVAMFFPDSRAAWTIFYLFYFAWGAVWIWILFLFPSGRVWSRTAVYWAIISGILLLSWGVPHALFSNEGQTYLYLGHGWSGLNAWRMTTGALVLVIWVPAFALVLLRIAHAAPGARRRLIPLYVGALGYFMVVIVPTFAWFTLTAQPSTSMFANFPGWWSQYAGQTGVVLFLSAVGAAFGLARVRRARSSVADLVVELGEVEPGQVRATLARSLGDPTLEIGLWLPEQGVWVDEEGRELSVAAGGDRGVTYVGERLAVMVHDRDLLDQPRLLEAVGSAGRLALENERLQAELKAQLRELQASRARIVRTADEERRRLERDLHDGAQQRLLGLGMGLQLLAGHTDDRGQALLEEVRAELAEALRELRELARGIHPAVLTDQGLESAVRTLAQRAAVPVTVTSAGERPPAHVETAAYFVVSEALANVSKYAGATRASVDLARENGSLRIEVKDDGVGGASVGAGSGLTGLADRLGALGGRLTLDSPDGGGTRLTALIPCS
jgi:signal transduction histidine kinase